MANYHCRVCKSKVKKDVEQAISEGQSFRDVAKHYLDKFDCDLHLLEQSIAVHIKKHLNNSSHSTELTQEDIELLERFRKGHLSFGEMQRELAARAFAKILKSPDSIHIRDWLQSEMIKIKRSELGERTRALEEAVSKLFGGHLPEKCSNCGYPLWESSKQTLES